MLDTTVKVDKKFISFKRKTEDATDVYIIIQDNLDVDSDVIGYSAYLPFVTEQTNQNIIVTNKRNARIKGVRKLFGNNVKHIEREENTLMKYIRHIVFSDYKSAENFLEIVSVDGLYQPKIMLGEIPKNKNYFDFKDGILLAETYKLKY